MLHMQNSVMALCLGVVQCTVITFILFMFVIFVLSLIAKNSKGDCHL